MEGFDKPSGEKEQLHLQALRAIGACPPVPVQLTEEHKRYNELAMRSQEKLNESYKTKWPDEASFVKAALEQDRNLGSR